MTVEHTKTISGTRGSTRSTVT